MIQLLLLLFFIFGTAIGSFLNVIAYRSVHGGSVLFGSSICPKCKHKLKPVDLVPILSFIFLRGRCRYCHKKISPQYPAVEFASGVLFALAFYSWYKLLTLPTAGLMSGQDEAGLFYQGAGTTYPINLINLVGLTYLLFIVSILVILFVTDLRDSLLPNSIVLPAIVVVVAYNLLLVLSGSVSIAHSAYGFLAAFLISAVFFAIVYFSREQALGGGDIKFVFLISLAAGWPVLLVALWLAFLTGGVVAAMLILTGRKRFGQTVPLGPFLSIGAIAALFWGQQIIDFYLKGLHG